jgi:small-conductance mechanosensitive channel
MPADERRRAARPVRRPGDPVVRTLLTLTAVLAVVAAVVVVLGEDTRVLRLGIVAGLWAALLAVAALVRRGAGPDEPEVAAREASLRRTYELEPAAEVDARREHTVPPGGRPWASGAGGRSVADLLATHTVHDAGPRRRHG